VYIGRTLCITHSRHLFQNGTFGNNRVDTVPVTPNNGVKALKEIQSINQDQKM